MYPGPRPCIECGIMTKSWQTRPRCRSCGGRPSKLGEKNPMWKGNDVGYSSLHEWVRKYKKQPPLCEKCNLVPPLDLANKGIYDRNFANWEFLCRRCHMKQDSRLTMFREMFRDKNIRDKRTYTIRIKKGWKIRKGKWIKPCARCKKMLPMTDKFFYRIKRTIIGFSSYCKQCERERDKIYYDKKIKYILAKI